jgi:hypothetical protein
MLIEVMKTGRGADNRVMRIRALLAMLGLGVGAATLAHAGVPDPRNCIADTCLVLSPAGIFSYTVVVKDESAAPVANVQVVLDFGTAGGMNLCDASDPDHDRRVVGTTNASGSVTFHIKGGGQTSGYVVVGAMGSVIVIAHARSTDLTGDLAVTAADVTAHSALPSNALAGDYNCDGVTDANDRSLINAQLGQDCNTVAVLDFTWGAVKATYR